ncbi:MAG TPA: hypothetical protein VFK03_03370, partial [Candidatus Saccharimonadales bacterium]|nr:hypothetical protein [Candidatus Saccharimonadales bacterium]
ADKAKRFKAEAYFSHQGYKTTPLATRTLSMNTDAGAIRYDLGQSSVITPAGKPKVKGGQGFGYFRLSTGYIKVETHCDDASQLPATIPALEAIEFSANNS